MQVVPVYGTCSASLLSIVPVPPSVNAQVGEPGIVAVPVTDTIMVVGVVSMPLPLPDSATFPRHVAVKFPEIDADVCDVTVHLKSVQPLGSGSPLTSCELQVPIREVLEFADDEELSDWLGPDRLEMCWISQAARATATRAIGRIRTCLITFETLRRRTFAINIGRATAGIYGAYEFAASGGRD